MSGRPKGSSRYATAKAFAKYLYEYKPGLGPDRIEQVMRRSNMPAHEIPSVETIKKWTKPWERGSVDQEPWDFLAASAADRQLMARYVVATSEFTRQFSISRVMVPEGVDPRSILPPVGPPQWPSAAVAEWFVAFATLDPPVPDSELAVQAHAAAADNALGRAVALEFMLITQQKGDEDGR